MLASTPPSADALPASYTDRSVPPAYLQDAAPARAVFKKWSEGRSTSRPGEPDGLPENWIALGSPLSVNPTTDMYVVRCPLHGFRDGYWAVVWYDTPSGRPALRRMAASANDLLRWYLPESIPDGATGQRHQARIHRWMVNIIAALYDTTDPSEAAERMLLLLGGQVRMQPAAASLPAVGPQ